jgi:hypothetical protein
MKKLESPWVALVVAGLMALAPLAATAEDVSDPSTIDQSAWVKKGLAYLGCAASIVTASSGAGVILMAVACGNAINEWFTE